MLNPRSIPDAESGQTIGYYVKGHENQEEFCQSVKFEYGEKIDPEKVEHTFFRLVPHTRRRRKGWELRVFRPKGKTDSCEFIRLQYCGMIELSVQDIKTYRGTLGKYTPVRYDFASNGKRNQGRNPILRQCLKLG